MNDENVTVIEPKNSVFDLGLKELWEYRELLLFLTWKQIKIRYKQTSIGIGWAVLQPIVTMVVFTIVFGHLAGLSSEGYSYEVFVFPTLILWIYFSTVLTQASMSLVYNSNLISKTYFPRMLLPISFCIAGLLDFSISLVILIAIMILENVAFHIAMVMIILMLALTIILAIGLSLWFSALAAKYRDIQYVTPIVISLLMFASPIIYTWSKIGTPLYREILSFNPLTGIMINERSLVLHGTFSDPTNLIIATIITICVFLSGIIYFRKYERQLADVI